eukprot:XP_011663352.1 PREDICTED: uncharacterized protein LOC105437902 [Strongylocentrotus purpuratus]
MYRCHLMDDNQQRTNKEVCLGGCSHRKGDRGRTVDRAIVAPPTVRPLAFAGFTPQVEFPVLLLVDGHASHVDLHVAEYCQQNEIILYRLQAHTSHIIQPLDLSVFEPLKKAYKKGEGEWKDAHPKQFVTKAFFAGVFAKAWGALNLSWPQQASEQQAFSLLHRDIAGINLLCRRCLSPSSTSRPNTATSHSSTTTSCPNSHSSTTTSRPNTATSRSSITTSRPNSHSNTTTSRPNTATAPTVIPAPPPAQAVASTSTAMPRRPTAYQYRPPTYVSPAFEKYLKFPEAVRSAPKRKTGDELPNAISGFDWIRYQTKRRSDKEAEEARKKKNREEREAKKAEKAEKEKKGGKRSRKVPREDEVDEMVCSECQDDFDNDDNDNCVGCNYCPRWFHVECTELVGLTREEVEATDFKCGVCDEE